MKSVDETSRLYFLFSSAIFLCCFFRFWRSKVASNVLWIHWFTRNHNACQMCTWRAFFVLFTCGPKVQELNQPCPHRLAVCAKQTISFEKHVSDRVRSFLLTVKVLRVKYSWTSVELSILIWFIMFSNVCLRWSFSAKFCYTLALHYFVYRIFRTMRHTGLWGVISANRSVFIHKMHQIIRCIKQNRSQTLESE